MHQADDDSCNEAREEYDLIGRLLAVLGRPILTSLEDLTDAERVLAAAFELGDSANFLDSDPTLNDPFSGAQWGSTRTLRAEVISKMLLTDRSGSGYPPRLTLIGARITGLLDLGCGESNPFLFHGCRFDEMPMLNDAKTSFIGFTECLMPGISASRTSCSGPVWLDGSRFSSKVNFEDAKLQGFRALGAQFSLAYGTCLDISGARVEQEVTLRGAKAASGIAMNHLAVEGNLILSGVEIVVKKGMALLGFKAKIGGSLRLQDGFRAKGGISLKGIVVGGQLQVRDADFESPGEIAVDLDHSRVDLGIFWGPSKVEGALRVHHATIGCQASFKSVSISSPSGRALQMDHTVIDGSLMVDENVAISGGIDLHGAKIECDLDLSKINIDASKSKNSAIFAAFAKVSGDLHLSDARVVGRVNLTDSVLAGLAGFSGAEISAPGAVALDLSRAKIGVLNFDKDVTFEGAVKLVDASIESDFSLARSLLKNPERRALSAARLVVNGDVTGDNFSFEGALDFTDLRVSGDVRLMEGKFVGIPRKEYSKGSPKDPKRGREWTGVSATFNGARIAGQLDLRGSEFGETLIIESAVIGRSMLLNGARLKSEMCALSASSVKAEGIDLQFKEVPRASIDLSGAQVDLLVDESSTWPTEKAAILEGFKYQRLSSSMSSSERLQWLKNATEPFASQPYKQLSECYLAAGQSQKSRDVQLAATRRQYEAGGILLRTWGLLQDLVIGFGHKPGRAIFSFLLLWASGAAWFTYGVENCPSFSSVGIGLCPVNKANFPTWDPWIYSLDLLIPVVNFGHKIAWDPTGFSKVMMYILVISGWLLTSAIVAALGRRLKRSE